jgi:hypothetical protein
MGQNHDSKRHNRGGKPPPGKKIGGPKPHTPLQNRTKR